MTPAERIKMMIANKLNNAHEKEKVKRIIREEEVEEAKKERQREWRYQVRVYLIDAPKIQVSENLFFR